MKCPLRFQRVEPDKVCIGPPEYENAECIGEECMWHWKCRNPADVPNTEPDIKWVWDAMIDQEVGDYPLGTTSELASQ